MKAFEEKETAKAITTFNEVSAINKISAITVDNGTVHIYTKNLYVQDDRTGKYHDIGTFHIQIGMINSTYDVDNTVRIYNTKYTGMGMNNGFQAPHVFEDGHACHGNLATGMIEAYRQRNLFDLVYQILIFLQSANTGDTAGQYINTWPEVPESVALSTEEEDKFKIEISETEKKFDAVLAEAIPIHVATPA